MPGIVVGIDGSTGSRQALEWAAHEATLTHAALTVLTVHPVMASPWTGNPLVDPVDVEAAEKARAVAEEAALKVTSQLDAQPSSVTVKALSGFVVPELIAASREADLLVVGSRGGGGFASLVLGSVSSQVVSHASCPVVVVPSQR
ncbi:MAG TPA: universal stress protein [Streptosporangiaceae bacterium]|jgi:nucleotide-binding universal stress UspA family protein